MASGDSLLMFTHVDETTGAQGVVTRNVHKVIPLALGESATFHIPMPQQYAATTGLTIVVKCTMESATANDVKVEAAFDRIGIGQQDIDASTFAAAQNSGDVTVPGTSGHVFKLTVTLTDGAQLDGLAADDEFVLKVTRIAVVGTDATGDLQITSVEVRET